MRLHVSSPRSAVRLLGGLGLLLVAGCDQRPAVGAPARAAQDPSQAPVVEADGDSDAPQISADGRVIVFESLATNLVANDTNGVSDIFRVDLATGLIERASVSVAGEQGDGRSGQPSVSGDGNRVAFASDATNLIAKDRNGVTDIFVRAWPQGSVFRASMGPLSVEANGASHGPDVSDNGKWMVFTSSATNLVADDTNGADDVFLYEFAAMQTRRVSVASTNAGVNGSSGAARVAGDGTSVAFVSAATDVVQDDANGHPDVFVNALKIGRTLRISAGASAAAADGASGPAAISEKGRIIVFESAAGNLVAEDSNAAADIFVHELETRQTQRVSISSAGAQATGPSNRPATSADGRIVVFSSDAANLVDGDTNQARDIFVHDRETRTTQRISVDSAGRAGNRDSDAPDVSADGRFVVFRSLSDNLVAGDSNGRADIFLHDRQTGATQRVNARR